MDSYIVVGNIIIDGKDYKIVITEKQQEEINKSAEHILELLKKYKRAKRKIK